MKAGERKRARVPVAAVRGEPRGDAMQVTQVLFGETLRIMEAADGWCHVRLDADGYEGYVRAEDVGPLPRETAIAGGDVLTPRFPRTLIFPLPDIKATPVRAAFMGAWLVPEDREGRFTRIAGGGWVITEHLAPHGAIGADPPALAETFLHAPYLWGGRTADGIDCSGLVQTALLMAGYADVPRDTCDQVERIGRPLPREQARSGMLRRGDLVFWKGHVAMMLDGRRIIHANAHHMRVAIEPLAEAMARIEASGGGPVTGVRRP